MQKLIATLLIFSASAALALPKVGDTATYDLSDGVATEQDVRTLVAYNPNTKQFQEDWSVVSIPNSHSQDWVNAADIDFGPYTAEHCTKAQGKMTQVKVPAGTFTACEIHDSRSVIYIADVPFGIVFAHFVEESGSAQTVALFSFHSGSR